MKEEANLGVAKRVIFVCKGEHQRPQPKLVINGLQYSFKATSACVFNLFLVPWSGL